MHPVLFQFGSHIVGTHNALIALGFIVGGALFVFECRRRGEWSEQMLWIVAGALIGGAIGAKVSAMLGAIGASPSQSMARVFASGGRSILGGLVGGYIGVVMVKRMVGYRRDTGDLFAPAIALGGAVGRWGCFFAELPGTPTSMPWGIRLTPLQVAQLPDCPAYCSTSALHPSMLYEIAFQMAMLAVIWFVWRDRASVQHQMLKLYLLCYATFRFFVEFVRGHDVMWLGLTGAQIFLLPVIVWLAVHFWRRAREAGVPLERSSAEQIA